ncbi:MFS transporter [Acetobacter thailandicus]|uniref:MFS transporter n=1 Tax=Acetobacter thailandicus TaxID=1502842 RepID=UPI001BA649ED|nr:MFS transporter [Acetobacter thailandicus]MBS0985483.1 MFS transporter [Acetobacter thailandicus]
MSSEPIPPISSAMPPVEAPHGRLVAMLILTAGTFVVGTGEFAIMGMLPEFAESLRLSASSAGYAITAYAIGVVIGAPLITILGARLSRRELLLLLFLLFAFGNILCVSLSSPSAVMAARFVTGLPHGAIFGISALVAASMAERKKRGQAVGQVLSGIAISTLIGAPLATFTANHASWRVSYLVIGLLGLCIFAGVWFCIPADWPNRKNSPLREIAVMRNVQVMLTLLTAAIGFGGMFGIYTYLTTVLVEVTHVPEWEVMGFMVAWGVAMLSGTNFGAWLADRSINFAALLSLSGSAVAMVMFPFVLHNQFALLVDMLAIAVFVNGLGPALQTRLMDFAGDAQTLAASLNHSAFNIANALGASMGSFLLARHFGYGALGQGGALLSLGGIAVFLCALLLLKRSGQSEVRTDI